MIQGYCEDDVSRFVNATPITTTGKHTEGLLLSHPSSLHTWDYFDLEGFIGRWDEPTRSRSFEGSGRDDV